MPYHANRGASSLSPRPVSCATKLCRMNTVPIGRITKPYTLSPPVAVAAIAWYPRCLVWIASANVITDWLARARTIGAASRSKVLSGAADDTVPDHVGSGPIVQGFERGKAQAGDPVAGRARGRSLE